MILRDLHTHTIQSFDAKQTIEQLCEAAIESGLTGVAVTNHYDMDGIAAGIYPPYYVKEDKKDIERARQIYGDRLEILFGVEIGQAHTDPERAMEFLTENGFDYVLSSLHNLRGAPDFYYFDFAKMDENQCDYWFQKYIEELTETVCAIPANTLGHITYPLRYISQAGHTLCIKRYEKQFTELFCEMVKTGTALEVNTSGLRVPLNKTMPDADTVALYRAAGGTAIAIGSDAHRAGDVGASIRALAEQYASLHMDVINMRDSVPVFSGTQNK